MQQTMYFTDVATSGGLAGTNSHCIISLTSHNLRRKLLPMIRIFIARLAPSKTAWPRLYLREENVVDEIGPGQPYIPMMYRVKQHRKIRLFGTSVINQVPMSAPKSATALLVYTRIRLKSTRKN